MVVLPLYGLRHTSVAMNGERDDWRAVGQRLALLQQIARAPGVAMAELLEISPQAWSFYRRGERELPIRLSVALKGHFGCSLEWIYLGETAHNTESFNRRVADALRNPERGKRHRRLAPDGDNSSGSNAA
jgi:hypothetical protein